MSADGATTRRIDLHLRKPAIALYAGLRPTLVIAGRGQPAQWGTGTWQVPADEAVTIGVYLFTRLWYFGRAEIALDPGHSALLVYRAPRLPFGTGSFFLET